MIALTDEALARLAIAAAAVPASPAEGLLKRIARSYKPNDLDQPLDQSWLGWVSQIIGK
jgi:hypothetical protein